MDVRRRWDEGPLVEILAALIEDLDTVVPPVVHKDATGLWVDGHAVHVIEVARALLVGSSALLAPRRQKFAVLVELYHTSAVVTVGDEDGAVRQPVQVRGAIEVLVVGAGLTVGADGLQFRLPVVRELVNHMFVIVDDPDALLRIVGTDGDKVWPLQHGIPLSPVFDQFARAVEHENAVFPAGIDAHLVARPFPSLDALLRKLPRPTISGWACGRRIPPRQPTDREGDARSKVREFPGPRRLYFRQLTAFQDEDSVWALGKHALSRPKRPGLVAGNGR